MRTRKQEDKKTYEYPFGPDFLERYMKACERQERRAREHPCIENLDIEQLKSEPRFLKFLEKHGLRLDGNGNIVEKEQQE